MRLGSILLLMLAGPVCGDDANDKRWQEYYKRVAKSYRVAVDFNGTPEPLPMRAKPVMRWQSINEYGGNVFVWTLKGRPEAVGTIFSFSGTGGHPNVVHEFASFSERPLKILHDQRDWTAPPIEQFMPLKDVPKVDASERVRKLHSRNIARRFSATMDRQGKPWKLRLLPSPIYEYGNVSEEVLGGALYVFVAFTTDPDLLLLLETRKTKSGLQWVYKPLRFSDKSLFLKFNNKEVWKSMRNGHGWDKEDTEDPQYKVMHFESVSGPNPAGSPSQTDVEKK